MLGIATRFGRNGFDVLIVRDARLQTQFGGEHRVRLASGEFAARR